VKIIGTYNIKGGVGKTATAVNLACLAAMEGYKTLLWDLDPQGAASFYYRIKPKIKGGSEKLVAKKNLDKVVKGTDIPGLDLIPSDFSYRNMDVQFSEYKKPARQLMRLLRPISEEYHLLFIDCPPNITLVSENVFYASDALVVPIIPTPLSIRTHEQLMKHLKHSPMRNLNLMPFFSMVDRRKKLHKDIITTLPKKFPNFMQSMIPYASQVELMGVHRKPLFSYADWTPAAQAYRGLWKELKKALNQI
jgi:cellulose biosynthesis protein BcsQ